MRSATAGRSPLVRCGMMLAGTMLILAGCTGGQSPEDPTPPATSTPPATLPPAPTSQTPPVEPIEFTFQAPDPPCPPASSLETLPLSGEHDYESFKPSLFERDDSFFMICGYNPVGARGDEDMIVEDHASVSANIYLYRRWEDSRNSRQQFWPELPVGSDDLDDWKETVWTTDRRRVRWEGCGPETPCQDGEEPTVRTYASQWAIRGHVGNLDFDEVVVQYIAEQIPADVESRVLAIARDVVLAVVDSYERID